MEDKQLPAQPKQPVQTPVVPPKPAFPWKITILLIVTIIISVAATVFFLKGYVNPFTSQNKPISTATPKPTSPAVDLTGWKTYTDTEAGFNLKYPPAVLFNEEIKGAAQSVLTIDVELLSSIPEDLPQFMGRKDALIQKEMLKETGESTVKIGTLNGLVATSLAGLDVCTVHFVRTITFYPKDYRVIISLVGPKEAIISGMPDFFKVDSANCGDQLIWNGDKITNFEEVLKNKEGKGTGQDWYDTFDAIIKTVTLTKTTPTNASACDVSDNAFCNVLADLKSALSAKNYAGFLAYQNLQSTTCDPDGMFVAICEGVAKGVVKQGYAIGYNQSEGTMVTKDDYLKTVSAYVNSNGPFTYNGSLISQDKGIAVFLNAKKDHILAFPMKRSGLTWRMDYLLLGMGDSAFTSLSDSILDY